MSSQEKGERDMPPMSFNEHRQNNHIAAEGLGSESLSVSTGEKRSTFPSLPRKITISWLP